MKSGWDRMTRWARMGNNEGDAANSGDGEMMAADIQDGQAMGDAGTNPEGGFAASEPVGPEAATPEQFELDQVRGECESLRAERDGLKDRLARLQAEFDNARKREARERSDAREYAVANTVEPFLGVMDNFNLALGSQASAEQLRSGVELILKQMEDALRGLQVTAVETVGSQFDPRIHEALGSIETAEHPDHQVIEEIRKGYKIREKLLRPALVKIATNAAQVPA